MSEREFIIGMSIFHSRLNSKLKTNDQKLETKMIKIEIVTGDITQIECDALVKAANNHFWMGGGVAGALKRAGGQAIEDEAIKKGPVAVGEAVVSGAGKLKAKYVIHAAVMGQDLQTDAESILRATRNGLLRADELGLNCIAFPALGTGVGGFPLEECARIMLAEIARFGQGETSLTQAILVLFQPAAAAIFNRELTKLIQ
jgi:O-acetyl-ADP-ribose deacetylase (regulator of RNase III)